jgi:hypothetical protein
MNHSRVIVLALSTALFAACQQIKPTEQTAALGKIELSFAPLGTQAGTFQPATGLSFTPPSGCQCLR